MPYEAFPQTTPEQAVVSGLQNFTNQVNQLAMQRSLQNAQEQINQANIASKDEFEKHQAYQMIGQQLAFQLAGAGADSTHIRTLMDAIPKPAPLPQNTLEALASENPRIREAGKTYEEQQQANKIAQLQTTGEYKMASAATAAQAKAMSDAKKAEEAARKTFNTQIDAFDKRKDVTPLLTGQDAIDTAKKQLAQSKNDPQAFISASIAALRAAGLTRITEFELQKMGGAYGLAQQFAAMSANSVGKVSDAQIAAVKKVLDVTEESNKSALKSKAEGYARALATSPGAKFTPQQYYEQLHLKHLAPAGIEPAAFDASGQFLQGATAAAASSAPSAAPSAPQGAFGIPGFTLR